MIVCWENIVFLFSEWMVTIPIWVLGQGCLCSMTEHAPLGSVAEKYRLSDYSSDLVVDVSDFVNFILTMDLLPSIATP